MKPLQFSIRFLLVLTAGVAVITAIALARGWPTIPPTVGLALAALNVAGYLKPVQSRPRVQWLLCLGGWLVFGVSFALPAVQAWGMIRGWEAAWFALSVDFGCLVGLFHIGPESWRVESPWLGLLVYTPLNIGNLLMIFAPLVLWLQRYRWGIYLIRTLVICASTAWIFFAFFQSGDDVLPGYYVWCLSFALVLSTQRLSWKALWSMLATMGVFYVLAFFGRWW